MHFVALRMVLVEEAVALHYKETNACLKGAPAFGEGGERPDQSLLDAFREADNGRDATHIHIVNHIPDGRIDARAKNYGRVFHDRAGGLRHTAQSSLPE